MEHNGGDGSHSPSLLSSASHGLRRLFRLVVRGSRSVLLAIVLHAAINFAFGGNGLVVLTEARGLLALFTVMTYLLAVGAFRHLHRTAPSAVVRPAVD
jgi:hypothetical protein